MFPGHNQSTIPEFFLLGFQVLRGSRIILFTSFLVAYISTIAGNSLIIVLVSSSHRLHSPMYFFLSHLSLCDVILSSTIAPNLLQVTLHNGHHMTVNGCITQLYFFSFSSVTECFLLTVMSYDRYAAICKPLHYQTIMSFTFCRGLVMFSWMLGSGLTSIITVLLSRLDFCYSGDIDHFFCDFAPLVQLSCSDTTIVQTVVYIIGTPETVTETLFIISTYVCIFRAIHRISSTTGKQKAFSTCSSHLAVVCMYYGTLIGIYIFSSGNHSISMNKSLSLVYTVVTPLLNPIIYSLRNQEIKNTIKNIFEKLRIRL
uniref:Olfactory receptor n=1 Tax=Leptobrachium leishanense TaxID=445787 RepID=A0A8C5M4C1_9ANUR